MMALCIYAAVTVLALIAPAAGQAQSARDEIDAVIKDYLAAHPDEVGEIAKGYLIKHPEAVGEILAEVLKHRKAAAGSGTTPAPAADVQATPDRGAAIAGNAAALFSSPHQVTLGNPNGDVTLVEFFDYSCGYCKRALPDMLTLINGDPNLKIVLKELPILGPGSAEAARIAVAVLHYLVVGELAGPRQEWPRRVVFIELAGDRQSGFLEHIPGILIMGQEAIDIAI